MSDLFFNGEYESQTNTVSLKLVGNLHDEDLQSVFKKESLSIIEKSSRSSDSKVWLIVDATETSFLSIKIIKEISNIVQNIIDRYVEGWVAVVSTSTQRMRLKIFFSMIGKNQIVVSSFSEAKKAIEDMQTEKGIFPK